MAGSKVTEARTPHEIDEDLADFIYGERRDEMSDFFSRRAGTQENAAALLAETFAKAAQLRMKRGDRSATDAEWVDSIAHLELSQFLRSGRPATKAVLALGLKVPEFNAVPVRAPVLLVAA